MEKLEKTLLVILGLVIIVGLILTLLPNPDNTGNDNTYNSNVKRFSSLEDINNYINLKREEYNKIQESRRSIFPVLENAVFQKAAYSATSDSSSGARDYSTTNIQVQGVDEADIVKNDGKYIYTAFGDTINIIDAYPAENSKILSVIKINGNVNEIFINDNKLVIFGIERNDDPVPYGDNGLLMKSKALPSSLMPPAYYYRESKSFVKVYDISDREKPELERNLLYEGSYFNSRMIDNFVYAIINQPIDYRYENGNNNATLPKIKYNEKEIPVKIEDVQYFDYVIDYSYQLTTIIALDLDSNKDKEPVKQSFLTGYSNNMYVSNDNIYLTSTKYLPYRVYEKVLPEEIVQSERTVIQKISINEDKIKYIATGEVPGHILNQFSMDEFKGNFRIATTIGEVFNGNSANNMYVLDENMNLIGKLENLARSEKIYSVRFIGNRAYMVTFKKVDPLFVIDLSIPENPKVLGELKIPGYSDYLHPYDENHIIGIGKEAVDASSEEKFGRNLDFAWYQGIKISLFDVSDVENPKEVSKFNIGDRGTDSEALRDHKAFLFDREKKLLVIPISLHEINREQYPNGVPTTAYGQSTFEGVYVLSLDLENGFKLKGRISHVKDAEIQKDRFRYYPRYYGENIRRSLYIDNVLYTISQGLIKANDLGNLEEINRVELPNAGRDYQIIY